jgi:hypothetical protein
MKFVSGVKTLACSRYSLSTLTLLGYVIARAAFDVLACDWSRLGVIRAASVSVVPASFSTWIGSAYSFQLNK